MPSLRQKKEDQLKAAARAQYQAEPEKKGVAARAASKQLSFCLILGSSGSLKLVCIFLIVFLVSVPFVLQRWQYKVPTILRTQISPG